MESRRPRTSSSCCWVSALFVAFSRFSTWVFLTGNGNPAQRLPFHSTRLYCSFYFGGNCWFIYRPPDSGALGKFYFRFYVPIDRGIFIAHTFTLRRKCWMYGTQFWISWSSISIKAYIRVHIFLEDSKTGIKVISKTMIFVCTDWLFKLNVMTCCPTKGIELKVIPLYLSADESIPWQNYF